MEKVRIDSRKKEECCGCTACAAACPHDAIRMEPDALGFLYPRVEEDKCTWCGLCERVCQFGPDYGRDGKLPAPAVYAARLNDGAQLARSQSGGAFYALAVEVLGSGGVVYGAGFTGHFHVSHKRVETLEGLEELRGSKYVQSDLRGVFRQVRGDLSAGRRVLFSGTPCQVAGLSSYVGKRLAAGLVTVDLVCHGVPAPAVWEDYLAYVEKKEGQECTGVNFRDKSFGWGADIHFETFTFPTKSQTAATFRILFYEHFMLRDSCHHCPFTNLKRCSDITVGDFWGWDKVGKRFNDRKGISLVLVNSEKGRQLFEKAAARLECEESRPQDCLQPQLIAPAVPHRKRARFIRDYQRHGFLYVARRYADVGLIWKLRKAKERTTQLIRKTLGA